MPVMPLLAVFLPLLLAYATALGWCWDLWWLDDGYFAHGPLVPIVMVLVVVLRRDHVHSVLLHSACCEQLFEHLLRIALLYGLKR